MPTQKKKKLGLTARFILWFLGIALVSAFAVGYLGYVGAQNALQELALDEVSSISEEVEASLFEHVQGQLNVLLSWASVESVHHLAYVASQAAEYRSQGIAVPLELQLEVDARGAAILEDFDDLTGNLSDFTNVVLTDVYGTVIAASDRDVIGSSYADDEAFLIGLEGSGMENVHLSDVSGEAEYALSVPVFEHGMDTPSGVLFSTMDPVFLKNITSHFEDHTQTGETLLVKRNENGDAVYIIPARFDSDAALSRIVSKDNVEDLAVVALNEKEAEILNGVDYAGNEVVASARHIEEYDIGLVTKISHSEAFAPVDALRTRVLLLGLGILVLVALVSLYASRSIGGFVRNPIRNATQQISELATQLAATTQQSSASAQQISAIAQQSASGAITTSKQARSRRLMQ